MRERRREDKREWEGRRQGRRREEGMGGRGEERRHNNRQHKRGRGRKGGSGDTNRGNKGTYFFLSKKLFRVHTTPPHPDLLIHILTSETGRTTEVVHTPHL